MREITYQELEDILDKKPTMFLCGNGFSINFDYDFKNIYDRLYSTHKWIMRNGKYNVKAKSAIKRIFTDNYNSIIKYLRNIKEKDMQDIFKSGIDFAESIIENKDLCEELKSRKLLHELVFGKSELDLVKSIYCVGRNRGYRYVNIEYWTILIYLYFAILQVDSNKYEFPYNNDFITLIKLGNINKSPIVSDVNNIYQYQLSNGFNIYYRMLFCTTILCEGKAVNYNLLENRDKLEKSNIQDFLNGFKTLVTLNYDHILENLTGRQVFHLHGQFVLNKQEFVYMQSIGSNLNDNTYISYANILIGDYFVNKVFAGIINATSSKKQNMLSLVQDCINANEIDVVVIFGLNIDNDQHILRSIMMGLENRYEYDVKIIYCYFSDEDKQNFDMQYNASITFSTEVSKRVRNMEVLYIKTKDILQHYFYK